MTEFFREVLRWKVDAGLLDSEVSRYFYERGTLDKITKEKYFLVLGSRGAGKTALARHLKLNLKSDWPAVTFTASNHLGEWQQAQKSGSNEAIGTSALIWQVKILTEAMQLIQDHKRQSYSGPRKKILEFGDKLIHKKKLKIWEFGIEDADPKLADDIRMLSNDIDRDLGENSYLLIIIDELDSDWSWDASEEYLIRIAALVKACQKIGLSQKLDRLRPVLFMRDDMYSRLSSKLSNQVSKLVDQTFPLKWTGAEFKAMVAFRIMRTADPDAEPKNLDIDSELQRFFSAGDMAGAEGRNVSKYNFMTACTLGRPRDVVAFMRYCAKHAIELGEEEVSTTAMKKAARDFSDYLWKDIEGEVSSYCVKSQQLMDAIRKLSRVDGNFNARDAVGIVCDGSTEGDIHKTEINQVLTWLEKIGAIQQKDPIPNNDEIIYAVSFGLCVANSENTNIW